VADGRMMVGIRGETKAAPGSCFTQCYSATLTILLLSRNLSLSMFLEQGLTQGKVHLWLQPPLRTIPAGLCRPHLKTPYPHLCGNVWVTT
jgi:hypothetical protein